MRTVAKTARWKKLGFFQGNIGEIGLVAGAGFEPATSGFGSYVACSERSAVIDLVILGVIILFHKQ